VEEPTRAAAHAWPDSRPLTSARSSVNLTPIPSRNPISLDPILVNTPDTAAPRPPVPIIPMRDRPAGFAREGEMAW